MSNVDGEIQKNRTTAVEVSVLQANGSPLANHEVVIAQTNHAFLFGVGGAGIQLATSSIGGSAKELVNQPVTKAAALFNFVTLPFYWNFFEPQRGQPKTDNLKQFAQWCVDHHLVVKGHPLCWHSLSANWLLSLSNEEILQAQIERIRREMNDFQGLINLWDVVNEAVIMPIFSKYDNGITRICKELGRIKTIKVMFEAARAVNPTATLLLNDFDTSPAFDILVEGCLEAG